MLLPWTFWKKCPPHSWAWPRCYALFSLSSWDPQAAHRTGSPSAPCNFTSLFLIRTYFNRRGGHGVGRGSNDLSCYRSSHVEVEAAATAAFYSASTRQDLTAKPPHPPVYDSEDLRLESDVHAKLEATLLEYVAVTDMCFRGFPNVVCAERLIWGSCGRGGTSATRA